MAGRCRHSVCAASLFVFLSSSRTAARATLSSRQSHFLTSNPPPPDLSFFSTFSPSCQHQALAVPPHFPLSSTRPLSLHPGHINSVFFSFLLTRLRERGEQLVLSLSLYFTLFLTSSVTLSINQLQLRKMLNGGFKIGGLSILGPSAPPGG